MSRISTSGRARDLRVRHVRSNGSPCVRSDRRSVRRTSNDGALRCRPGPARPLDRHGHGERADHRGDPRPLLVGQVRERLLAQDLDAARHDPDRRLPRRAPPARRPAPRQLAAVEPTWISRFVGLITPVDGTLAVARSRQVELDPQRPASAETPVPRGERLVVGLEVFLAPDHRGPARPVERVTIGETERSYGAAERQDPPGADRGARARGGHARTRRAARVARRSWAWSHPTRRRTINVNRRERREKRQGTGRPRNRDGRWSYNDDHTSYQVARRTCCGAGWRVEIPQTRYATTADGIHIGYQVIGSGPIDLIFVPYDYSNIEASWDLPQYASFVRGLASHARVLLFDRRGSGTSDPVGILHHDRGPDGRHPRRHGRGRLRARGAVRDRKRRGALLRVRRDLSRAHLQCRCVRGDRTRGMGSRLPMGVDGGTVRLLD